MYRKHFPAMLLPTRYRKLPHANVEQLDASIASCGEQLILMLLRPGNVKQAVLRLEELLADDAVRGQVEDIETSIADQPKIGTGSYGESVVEEG